MQTKWLLLLIFSFFFSMCTGRLKAQTTEKKYPEYIVSVKPLLLTDGEFKISLEKRLKGKKEWIGIGLSGFYLPTKTDGTWETRNTLGDSDCMVGLKGGAIDFTYKYYFTRMVYLGGDLFYGHYRVKYNAYYFQQYEEDGLVFYERMYGNRQMRFDKIAGNLYFGVGSSITNKVFVDTYLGIGHSSSFYEDHIHSFNNIFGFGYRGFYPVLGLRVGMTF